LVWRCSRVALSADLPPCSVLLTRQLDAATHRGSAQARGGRRHRRLQSAQHQPAAHAGRVRALPPHCASSGRTRLTRGLAVAGSRPGSALRTGIPSPPAGRRLRPLNASALAHRDATCRNAHRPPSSLTKWMHCRTQSGTFPPPSLKAEADPNLVFTSLDGNSNNILDSVRVPLALVELTAQRSRSRGNFSSAITCAANSNHVLTCCPYVRCGRSS
jgi:hypothetical protein